MRFASFLLSLALLTACLPSSVAPSTPSASAGVALENAVRPWSRELQNAEPYPPPFLARFEKGDRALYFVADVHGCDPGTFRLVEQALGTGRPRVAIVEGAPAAAGVNPAVFTDSFTEWSASGFCAGGGAPGYTAFHATQSGVSFMGGEPDEESVVQAVQKQGFSVDDLLGFYFLRQVPQLRREGELATKGLEPSFRLLVDWMGKKAGLEVASRDFSLDRFRDWYATRQGKPFDLATVDREETAPMAAGTFAQRLSALTGLTRDRFLVQLIAQQLATHERVLIVYGGSHFATLREALELLMGRPVEIRAGTGVGP